jgi:CBS domain-containing protein
LNLFNRRELLTTVTEPTERLAEEAITPNYARLALADATAKDAMSPPQAVVTGKMTIQEFYQSHVDMGFKTYLVLEGQRLEGIVSIKDLGRVSKGLWEVKTINDVMTRAVIIAYPDDKLHDVLERMILHSYQKIPIISKEDPGTFLGVVTRRDVLKHFLAE